MAKFIPQVTPSTDYSFDLGAYSRPISTQPREAQEWFDRGLNWIFGYHHEEATVCFQKALEYDAELAMAYWGVAYCAGPNYNMSWELFDDASLDVVKGNQAGILADLKYWNANGAMNFYSLYRIHNYHFKLYGAMFQGNFAAAMDAVKGISETIPDELVRMQSPPMVDFIEGYMGMKTHALVRFGQWQRLLDNPMPEDPEFYCTSAALNCYGKGVAHAALGHDESAHNSFTEFEKHAANVSDTRYVHVVTCQEILAVAREMLMGEIEYHAGNHELAFKHLRLAVKKEDVLPYDEPWGWMMPSRHALGALLLCCFVALLLEQKQVAEAMETYESDLGLNSTVIRSNQHPDNVWALMGLHECYQKLGLDIDARRIKPRLDVALARSDLDIKASCFCSTSKFGNSRKSAQSKTTEPA